MPLGPGLLVPLALSLDLLFLLSLFALPRPRRWTEFWCLLLAALSSSTIYAVERANLDIALYLLVLGAAHLLLRGRGARLTGYAAVLLGGAIKFYPACLMLLAARERPRVVIAIALGSLAGAILFTVSFRSQLGQVLPRLPHDGPLTGIFAASNLPLGLAFVAATLTGRAAIGRIVAIGTTAALAAWCPIAIARFVPAMLPGFRMLTPRPRMLLLAGAMTITFCFFAARNIMYREIFLIMALPGLWEMARNARDPAVGARLRLASWVVTGLLCALFVQFGLAMSLTRWPEGMLGVLGVWLLREACWWWLISMLLSIIICFLWDAPLTKAVCGGAAMQSRLLRQPRRSRG